MILNKIRTTIVLILIALSGTGLAQGNVDSVFTKAIDFSRANKFKIAIAEAQKALKMDSLRGDIHVFTANVYSWQEQNDSAMIYLGNARKLNYLNDEFYEAVLNVLLRANKNDSLLTVCDEAQKKGYKNQADLLKKRVIVYDNKMEYSRILAQFKDSTSKTMLVDSQLAEIYHRAKNELTQQMVGADYNLDIYSTGRVHQFASISYTNKFDRLSTTLSLNYANRFNQNDLQVDYTGYLKLLSKNYWYLNYGYAFRGNLFAKHRVGLEYFYKTKKATEASLGMRYLFYPGPPRQDVWIATGSVGVYFKNNWLSFRPYYVMQKNRNSLSFNAKFRTYKENPLEYSGFEFGFGNSPDDIYTSTQGSFNELMSYRLRYEKSKVYGTKSQFVWGLGLVQEQYTQGTNILSRFRFLIDLGYRYRF